MLPVEKLTCYNDCETRKYTDQLIKSWGNSITSLYTSTNVIEGLVNLQSNDTSNSSLEVNTIKGQNEIYKSQTTTLEKLKSDIKKLLKENEVLNKTIDSNRSTIYTNDRKVVYEEWARDRLFTIGTMLRSLYILVLMLYLYYGPLIKNKEWRTPRGWIIPVCLILFPFTTYHITLLLRTVYDKIIWVINNKSVKNVYV